MHAFPRLSLLFLLSSSVSCLIFKSETIEVNFDDRRRTPAAFQLNTVGTYGRLHWDGFSIDQPHGKPGSDDYTGVEVKSEPNYGGSQVDAFGVLPSISTSYPNSNVAFFDFETFWWGCSTTDDDTLQQVPGWCTLEVYGYGQDTKEPIAKAVSFFFPKEDAESMPMVEAHLPSTFNAVSRVEFSIVAKRPILYLDNLKYKIYNVTSMGHGLREFINSGSTSQSEFVMQVGHS